LVGKRDAANEFLMVISLKQDGKDIYRNIVGSYLNIYHASGTGLDNETV